MVPSDFESTRAIIRHIASEEGPFYVRLSREKTPDIYEEGYSFKLSEPTTLADGSDVTIFSTGFLVAEAIKASYELAKAGVSAKVLDVHSIKPINGEFVAKAAKETGCIVTAEEHSIFGGLGSSVAEEVVERYPVPMKRVGVRDRFGISGPPLEVLDAYEIISRDIVKAALEVVKRK
jgi:transketolase